MVFNRLKLNQDKPELLLISSRYRQSLALSYLEVGEEKICPSKSVRNLGVHFDRHARMHVHVKNVCQASCYHLRNISKIRRYLSQDTTEILIHACITSKLAIVILCSMDFQPIWLISYRQYRRPLLELLPSQRNLNKLFVFYASFTGYLFNIELFLKYSC